MRQVKEVYEALKALPEGINKHQVEIQYCHILLERYNGNRRKTAKKLGVSIRSLWGWIEIMESMGLAIPRPYLDRVSKIDLAEAMACLKKHGWIRSRACEELGICARTINKYIRQARLVGYTIPESPRLPKKTKRRS